MTRTQRRPSRDLQGGGGFLLQVPSPEQRGHQSAGPSREARREQAKSGRRRCSGTLEATWSQGSFPGSPSEGSEQWVEEGLWTTGVMG